MSDSDTDEYDPGFQKVQLAWQPGCAVRLDQPGTVLRQGPKVRPSEVTAIRLVMKCIPDVPVLGIHGTRFRFEDGVPFHGELSLDFIPGRTLKTAWAGLSEASKDCVCQDIRDLVARIRTVPSPDDLAPGLYQTVDGTPSLDPLVWDNNDVAPRRLDDDTLQARIYARYVACNGISYRDGKDVRDLLPRSDSRVFAHGDIGPRNIMVDEDCRIVALLDWESSG